MPLIILSGYPSSGLTHRATQLASLLQKTQDDLFASGAIDPSRPRYKVTVVPTHDASHPRSVYDNARTEKMARGVAYARAKRALGKDTFVILDGMNYIKGYRYQLWCEAKAVGTTCCVVHVGTPIEQCRANNEAKLKRQAEKTPEQESSGDPSENEAYPPELLENLIFRYEEPSTHSRWDKPLFTVPYFDAEPPIADIWTALTGIPHPSATAPQTSSITPTPTESIKTTSDTASIATGATGAPGTGLLTRTRPKIKPHAATVLPTATDSSALYSLEKRTSAIISSIRTFTLSNPSATAILSNLPPNAPNGITIEIPDVSTPIFIPAHVAALGSTDELAGAGGVLALPRLQRLKRQWIGLNRAYVGNYSGGKGGALREEEVGGAFVRFLNAEFAGEGS
ncbi:hypothetical protein SI65_09815 [Aspergillus cristatus]|uniref:Protein kti12 n=1 Tax=Aspergillus cristatus TaxID=573508 RepID=A0A1E3B1W4_ASPCR|nr:hypothetical protein SI65_09815 [Aspergillus cristatus]